MADIVYTAACPACGNDAEWRDTAPGVYVPATAPVLQIEVRCEPCDQSKQAERG